MESAQALDTRCGIVAHSQLEEEVSVFQHFDEIE